MPVGGTSTVDPVFAGIPAVRDMGLSVQAWDGREIRIRAPLDRHRNDKGTAFAGSLYSLLVLAGWALVTRALGDRGLTADVLIAESATRYRQPVRDELAAAAVAVSDLDTVAESVRRDGRARARVRAWMGPVEAPMATFDGWYAVRATGPGQAAEPSVPRVNDKE